jgi:D-inositol-3-phosphate glycosyltransferase
MRVAMVSEHANPLAAVGGVDAGGQNVHVAALAEHLVRRGHEVTVFTRRDDPGPPDRVLALGGFIVEHVPAGPPTEVPKDHLWQHMPAFASYLAARYAVERFDLVHAHFWMSGSAATTAALPLGIPVVQTFHALGSVKQRHQGRRDTSPRERVRVESRLCQLVDHVVATCHDEVGELRALGADAGRISVVPCGVDTRLFVPRPSRRHGRHRVLVVGRLVERKGVADVVRVLPGLPGVELVIAGGPAADALAVDPEVCRLQRLARANHTLDRITFLGAVDRQEMPGVIADADVVVAVPWYEPFGIVPVEAMACGRPVIGSAVGGLLDTIVPGVTGELVPPRRPDLLAAALRSLLADPQRRTAYGAAGVIRANRHFGWAQVAARTEAVYKSVLSRSSAARQEVPL